MKEQDYIVKDDMICPVTKAHCDDECCPVGSTCNMSNNETIFSGDSFFWEGWEENERERQGGGMLIVIAFIAGIAAIAGTVIYVLTRL